MTEQTAEQGQTAAPAAQPGTTADQGAGAAPKGGAAVGSAAAVKMPPLDGAVAAAGAADGRNLEVILDVPVTLSMEIGRSRVAIRNLLQLNPGSVVELDRLAGEPLDVLVNGTLIAHGEVVIVNERYGIRFTDVVSPAERVKKLR